MPGLNGLPFADSCSVHARPAPLRAGGRRCAGRVGGRTPAVAGQPSHGADHRRGADVAGERGGAGGGAVERGGAQGGGGAAQHLAQVTIRI
eukprot:2373619-Pyramimonas_sp.AAC.1